MVVVVILGGSRGLPPPRKFLKLGVKRLNLEVFSVVLAVNQILVLFNKCLIVVQWNLCYGHLN